MIGVGRSQVGARVASCAHQKLATTENDTISCEYTYSGYIYIRH